MRLEKLLKEIKFEKEIIEIFQKIETKKENLNKLTDQLLAYKNKLETKSFEEFKIDLRLHNLHKVLSFIEDVRLSSFGAIEHDFDKKQTIDNSKIYREFMKDWTKIDEMKNNYFSQLALLETTPLLAEVVETINNEQNQSNEKSKNCFACTIL